MSTTNTTPLVVSGGNSLIHRLDAGFRTFLENLTRYLFTWWLKPLLRIPYLRAVIRGLPNYTCVFRIIYGPIVVMHLYTAARHNQTGSAWRWLGIAAGLALLDGIDGPLARQLVLPDNAPIWWWDFRFKPVAQWRRDSVTKIGKGLDPLADKIFFVMLGVYFCQLSAHRYGAGLTVIVTGVLLAAYLIELQLTLVVKPTEKVCRKLDVEVPGANHWGKKKFATQLMVMGGGWALAIVLPLSALDDMVVLIGICLAIPLAVNSLRQHRRELYGFEADWAARTAPDETNAEEMLVVEPTANRQDHYDLDPSNIMPLRLPHRMVAPFGEE